MVVYKEGVKKKEEEAEADETQEGADKVQEQEADEATRGGR